MEMEGEIFENLQSRSPSIRCHCVYTQIGWRGNKKKNTRVATWNFTKAIDMDEEPYYIVRKPVWKDSNKKL